MKKLLKHATRKNVNSLKKNTRNKKNSKKKIRYLNLYPEVELLMKKQNTKTNSNIKLTR